MTGVLREYWMEPPVRAVMLLAALMQAVLIGGTAFLLYDIREREIEYARAEISSLSRILAEEAGRTLDGVVLALRGAQDRLSDGIGRELPLDSFPVLALLKARSEGLPQFASMFVVDADGVVENSTLLGTRPGLNESSRDYFVQLRANDSGIHVGQLYRRRFDGEWAFYIGARLEDEAGNFRGVVAAAVVANYFESFYRQINLRFGKEIQLLTSRGNLVASYPQDAERIDHPVSGLPSSLGGESVALSAREAALVTERDGGMERFVAYQPVPRYPFMIAVSIGRDAALMSWPLSARPIVLGAGGVSLLLLCAAGGLAWSLRRRAVMARALRESDERLREMVGSVTDAIVTLDEHHSIVLFNRAAEKMFGVSAATALGRPFAGLLAAESSDVLQRIAVEPRAADGDCPRLRGRAEVVCRHADGREFPADAGISSNDAQGQCFLTIVLRDLTERKRIENHLRETNRQLQEVSTALQTVREDERAGIAREMHDELGQRLTALKLEMSWLGSRLPADRPDLQDKLALLKDHVGQTITSVRRITYELRPLILDDLGLRAAVSWLTDDFAKRVPVELVLDLDDTEPERGSAEATALFRVLQESLTNVMKYARANTVWVTFRLDGAEWRLSVRDDGVGFALDGPKRAGFGILGMRERIRLLKGTFALHTLPGDGTTIEVTVPA